MSRILTAQGVIEQYYAQRPKMVWRVGADIMPDVRKLKDDDSRYLCFANGESTTLLGVPIRVVGGSEFELVIDDGK